jgi:hypothetical protein
MVEEAGRLASARADRFLPSRRWRIGRAECRRSAVAARRRWPRGIAAALGVLLLGFSILAGAAPPVKKNPSWSELTPEQQQILAPLAGEWDKLDPVRKKKWLGIAKRYPKMTPIGQKRTQTRMKKWVNLSPEQRREAREKNRRFTKLPPEKRQELTKRWAEYQALPPSERQKTTPPPSDSRSAKRSRTPPPDKTTGDSWEW